MMNPMKTVSVSSKRTSESDFFDESELHENPISDTSGKPKKSFVITCEPLSSPSLSTGNSENELHKDDDNDDDNHGKSNRLKKSVVNDNAENDSNYDEIHATTDDYKRESNNNNKVTNYNNDTNINNNNANDIFLYNVKNRNDMNFNHKRSSLEIRNHTTSASTTTASFTTTTTTTSNTKTYTRNSKIKTLPNLTLRGENLKTTTRNTSFNADEPNSPSYVVRPKSVISYNATTSIGYRKDKAVSLPGTNSSILHTAPPSLPSNHRYGNYDSHDGNFVAPSTRRANTRNSGLMAVEENKQGKEYVDESSSGYIDEEILAEQARKQYASPTRNSSQISKSLLENNNNLTFRNSVNLETDLSSPSYIDEEILAEQIRKLVVAESTHPSRISTTTLTATTISKNENNSTYFRHPAPSSDLIDSNVLLEQARAFERSNNHVDQPTKTPAEPSSISHRSRPQRNSESTVMSFRSYTAYADGGGGGNTPSRRPASSPGSGIHYTIDKNKKGKEKRTCFLRGNDNGGKRNSNST